MIFYDFEVFKYNWLVVIIDVIKKEKTIIVDDSEKLKEFYELHKNDVWVGYNNKFYDQYILKGILCDFNPKKINDFIILKGRNGWEYSSVLNKIKLLNYDCMIMNKSLKQLEGMMGNSIEESSVPFDIERALTDEEIKETIKYCTHDVEQTIEVFTKTKEDFNASLNLIKTFNLNKDLIGMSKARLSSIILKARRISHDDEFNITFVPSIALEKYAFVKTWYENNKDYSKELSINIDNVDLIFKWGGLHGARKKYKSNGIIVNSDVGSYYPSLAIEYDFLSRNVKNKDDYKNIYDYRMTLKHQGKKKEQAPYKLVLNISYGASKDKNNPLYDSLQANNICINGQLLLLDLIEKVYKEIPTAHLVQANTDGVMWELSKNEDLEVYKKICDDWCNRTKMTLEHDYIKKVIQKDVNNYLVIMQNGKVKSKGAYLKSMNELDNDYLIVNEALKEYLVNDVPISKTINKCDELIKFQKIVKITSKYESLILNNERLKLKCVRVFASKLKRHGELKKLKKGKEISDKIGNLPSHSFLDNADIKNKKVPPYLDKNFYIEMCEKRAVDIIGT